MGAAFLAGLAVGVWDTPGAVAALRTSERTFTPAIDPQARTRMYAGWRAAVERVKSR
jgi:glycerol kinase